MDVDGFSLVIGNPPYIGFHGPVQEREYLRDNYLSAKGKFDYYLPFIENGLRQLRKGGILSYICPTNFTKRGHGAELRQFLKDSVQVAEICDFADHQVFSGALNYTGIFTFRNTPPSQTSKFIYKGTDLVAKGAELAQSQLSKEQWLFPADATGALLAKLQAGRNQKLSEITSEIAEGIVTGKNDVFLVSVAEFHRLCLDPSWFRSCVRGREVRKYYIEPPQEVVFYPYRLLNGKTTAASETELRKSANTWTYITRCRNHLKGRAYFDASSKKWYELWCQRNMASLSRQKIVVAELSNTNRFAIAEPSEFYGDTVCGIMLKPTVKESLSYMLAILNSHLIEWFYKRTTVPKANGFYIFKTMFLKNIPVRRIDFAQQGETEAHDGIVSVVEKIAHLKRKSLNTDTRALEREIDQRVYALYGLTPEEIKIVEDSTPSSGQRAEPAPG